MTCAMPGTLNAITRVASTVVVTTTNRLLVSLILQRWMKEYSHLVACVKIWSQTFENTKHFLRMAIYSSQSGTISGDVMF